VPRIGKRPIESVVAAFFTSVHSRFARELEQVPKGVDLVVFAGKDRPVEDFRDFESTSIMLDEGRQEVRAVLDGIPVASQPDDGLT
jgi:hypothetical protein